MTLTHDERSILLTKIEHAFKCHYRPLNLFALHYLKDIDTAEDVVQECFADLWEQLKGGRSILDIKSYLFTMVKNRSLAHLTKEKSMAYTDMSTAIEETLPDEELEEKSYIEARLWLAIDKLPERCREIFLLNKRDGLKYQEVANQLGISINTVENQISKALKILRDGVNKIYYFFFG